MDLNFSLPITIPMVNNNKAYGKIFNVKKPETAPNNGGNKVLPIYAKAIDKPIIDWDACLPKRAGIK